MSFKLKFLAIFREFFIYHHKSLEFRAKIFAAMLVADKNFQKSDLDELKDIAQEIYPNDKTRIEILLATTLEFIDKCNKELNLDALLFDIDSNLKQNKKFAKKIDFSHLRRLMSDDEDEALIQQRVYEFLVNEVKIYLN